MDLVSSFLNKSEIEKQIEDMNKLIENPTFQSVFKDNETFKQYSNPLISSIHNNDYESLQEQLKFTTDYLIKPDYLQTLKASETLYDSIEKAKALALGDSYIESYSDRVDSISKYFVNDKLSAASDMLGLSSKIDTDLLKSGLTHNTELDKIIESSQENIEKINGFNSDINKLNYIEIPKWEPPKYEDTLMGKADKQIEHLENVVNYIVDQTEKIEEQRQISIQHNNMVKEEIEDNAKTSKRDFRILLISVLISITVPFIISYIEDISDNNNHKELINTLNQNNQNGVLKELVTELKIQNEKSSEIIDILKKENSVLKNKLEEKNVVK